MAKQTIHQAISEVMREAGRPLSSGEIYDQIVARGLYEFKAKDPANIVRGQLRRHCVDVKAPRGASSKYFKMTADGQFALLDSPDAE
jgi:hypothetical protein